VSRNGDTFDPRASDELEVPTGLPPLNGKPPEWLLAEAVRRSHHAWQCSAAAVEQTRQARTESRESIKLLRDEIGAVAELLGRTASELTRLQTHMGLAESVATTAAKIIAGRPPLPSDPLRERLIDSFLERDDTEVRRIKAEIVFAEKKRLTELEKANLELENEKRLQAEAAEWRAAKRRGWIRVGKALLPALVLVTFAIAAYLKGLF